jgi:hypothetical protein
MMPCQRCIVVGMLRANGLKARVAILLPDPVKADAKGAVGVRILFRGLGRTNIDLYLLSRSQFSFFTAYSPWLSKSISLTTSYASLEMIVIVIHEKVALLRQFRTYLQQMAAGRPGCSCSEVS